jgi:chromosome partitioning protein
MLDDSVFHSSSLGEACIVAHTFLFEESSMAGTIITIAQQKGGAGKTTLAAHLALAWAAAGQSVAVIDIDPQASLSTWFRLRRERRGAAAAGIDVVSITGWRVAAEVDRQARGHDVVVIDSPPHAETEARIAVRSAKLVLVPVQPSPMDLWATKATLDLARAEHVPALLVLNRVPPRANLTEAMLAEFLTLDAALAQTQIGNRVALAASLAEGKGILEAAPGSRAAEEIQALALEVLHAASSGFGVKSDAA